MVLADFRILFNAPLTEMLRTAKAMILSKTGSKIANPDQTRLIVINPLARKIVDKIVYEMINQELWNQIGKY
jgi:hypothetical protein